MSVVSQAYALDNTVDDTINVQSTTIVTCVQAGSREDAPLIESKPTVAGFAGGLEAVNDERKYYVKFDDVPNKTKPSQSTSSAPREQKVVMEDTVRPTKILQPVPEEPQVVMEDSDIRNKKYPIRRPPMKTDLQVVLEAAGPPTRRVVLAPSPEIKVRLESVPKPMPASSPSKDTPDTAEGQPDTTKQPTINEKTMIVDLDTTYKDSIRPETLEYLKGQPLLTVV